MKPIYNQRAPDNKPFGVWVRNPSNGGSFYWPNIRANNDVLGLAGILTGTAAKSESTFSAATAS
jgi:hypothetical protein